MKRIDISLGQLTGNFYTVTAIFYLKEGKVYRHQTTARYDVGIMSDKEGTHYKLGDYPIACIFQSKHLPKGQRDDFPPLIIGGVTYEQWYLDAITLDRGIQDRAVRDNIALISLPFFNYEGRLSRTIFRSHEGKGMTFEFEMLSNAGTYVPILDNLGVDPVLINPLISVYD